MPTTITLMATDTTNIMQSRYIHSFGSLNQTDVIEQFSQGLLTYIYTWHVDTISNYNVNELFGRAVFSEQNLAVENLCMALVKTIS